MTTPLQADDSLVGRLLDGRYRLTRTLARGGMATVYVGVDERLDRPVAVKVMHRGLADDPDFVARFTREARSAARLSAPEVVAVFDQGRDPATGAAYLVMEHVQGCDLRALLRQRGALPPARAAALLEPVLRALAAAHRAGLVHRDVKPENVLLGDDGRVKVADFGLARAVQASELTATTGLLIGTVAYLAPEQVELGTADARTDVYAAGIMLWEALTGAPPYAADTPMRVAFQHVHSDVPAPSTVVPGVPAGLDDLVVRATRRDPARRPADAGAFLTELRAVRPLPGSDRDEVVPQPRTHDTLVAPAPPRPAATRRPRGPRRRRRVLVGLLVALLLTGGGGGAAWWFAAGRWTTAPGVLSLAQADALAALDKAGLAAREEPTAFSETVPAGAVLEQDPEPAARVTKGGTVTLVLSKGPDRRAVPATLVGSTQAAATAQLAAVGLRTGAVTPTNGAAPEGTVLSTDPPAGTQLRADAAVALVVSNGVELVPVPSAVGSSQADAQALLTAARLKATVTEAFDETAAAGTVVAQSPAGGTAPAGSAVALTVSKGPDLRTIGELVGLPRDSAQAALQAQGLRVRVLAIPGPGTVRSVDPPAGTKVRKGSTVTLYVF